MQPTGPLTERELEVLELVAKGITNREIAEALHISVNTVKVHLRNIFQKLEVYSRTEATLYALNQGWLELEEREAPPLPPRQSIPEITSPQRALELQPSPSLRVSAYLYRGLGISLLLLLALAVVSRSWKPARSREASQTAVPTPPMTASRARVPPRWTERAPLPKAREALALVAFAGGLYAIGGESPSGITGAVERYSSEEDAWSVLTSKPTPVRDISAVVLGGKVYVPGGRDPSGRATRQLDIYNPSTDTWEEGVPLPIPLAGYALSVCEGRMYLFGGWDGEKYQDGTYIYDPASDSWQPGSKMPHPLAFAASAQVEGRIYIMGGHDGRRTLAHTWEYNPSQEKTGGSPWRQRASLGKGCQRLAAVALGGSIYAVGGRGEGEAMCPVKRYDVTGDSWMEMEAPPVAQWHSLGMAAVGTKLYAAGGRGTRIFADLRQFQALYHVFLPVSR